MKPKRTATAGSAVGALIPHFRFPLEDPQARSRFVLGSVLLLAGFLIPIVPTLFVLGYSMQVLRRTIDGQAPSMHAWTDWSAMLRQGFRFWVASFVYFLPGLAVMVIGFVIYLVAVFAMTFSSGAEGEAAAFVGVMLSLAAMFLGLAVGTILLVAASIPFPAALAHAAAEDSLAAAFRFRQWWPIWRSHALGFVIAWVLLVGLGGVAYLAAMLTYYTLVLCLLLPLLVAPAYFYILLVAASVTGELYAESRARLGSAV